MKYLSSLRQKNFNGEICLLRVDLNITSDKGLASNPRVFEILPTIQFLTKRRARVVILSHRGRPNGHPREFTLKPFTNILSKKLRKNVRFLDLNFKKAAGLIKKSSPSGIFLLENLRFLPGEDKNDRKLAKRLASLGTFYVNDAFAFSHRKDASMVAITKFLPSYAGLLLEKEIKNLSLTTKKSKHPFIIILGGAKISDKIVLIKNFLKKADYFLIGGGIANTFVAAQGLPVGDSLYEQNMIPEAQKLLRSLKIILPQDFVVKNRKMLDIGPKTARNYGAIIKKAKTIIWNGPMGYIEDKRFRKGSETIIKAIFQSRAFSVIGGGETISLIQLKTKNLKLKTNIFISTGGGAMLEYLAGVKLPAITALERNKKSLP